MNLFLRLLLCSFLLLTPAQATTVICDGKSIASDSQLTYDYRDKTVEIGHCDKIHIVRGYVVGAAGRVYSINKFLRWLDRKGEYPFNAQHFECIVVCKAGCFRYDEDSSTPQLVFYPVAIGSGGEDALHGYLWGMTLKQAVEHAEKKDKGSGGKVTVIHLNI